ncbi:serpin family protein [Sphingomonas swuensis]|uniref:Serpin family protein n=1 Tax=Sphingomonas swuensis TaxID=977800 RepID=A0ABP7SLG6_9SPHN
MQSTQAAADPPRRAAGAAEKAIPWDLTQGLGYFAARFYKPLTDEAGPNANLFISPLSLSQGLGLAWLGARGQTAEEMRAVLGWWEGNPATLTSRYNIFLLKTDDPKVEMRIANALWLAEWLPVRSEYLAAARDAYDAAPETVNFARAPDAAPDRINGWVSDWTRGRIPKIVVPDQFNDLTAAVLTNAVYFKADWQTPFVDGAEATFTTGSGSKKPIYLMERIGPMQYRENSEGQAVVLPYGNGRFVMEVFLPRDAATLRQWEQKLHGSTFQLSEQGSDERFDLGAAKRQTVLLRLPRFEARFNQSVNEALAAAGMPCAFRKDCADFSGIAPAPMKIDRVAHATFLRVDEQGTEAAAATAVTIVATGSRITPADIPRMIVDRPFLVTIRDRASEALIFFGRIADPTAVAARTNP